MTLFRIRMSCGLWYVRQYDADKKHVADHGPYTPQAYAEAERWALAQGWQDWDKCYAK